MKQPDTHLEAASPSAAVNLRQKKLRGILLPFPTPFDASGEVDARAVRTNIERWNETRIDGYIALGSTGERVHLSGRECFEVISAAREAVPQHLAFVVGVGHESARASIAEARRAAEAGADALLVITPHFYRAAMTQGVLYDYYVAVADAAPAPLVLYNIPQNTGVALSPETVARLSRHENIVGIKDSSGDMVNLMEMLGSAASEKFAVLTGHASLLYAALSAGADGAILAAACAAPRTATAIAGAVARAEHERARDMQRVLGGFARTVSTRYGIGGLKAALDMSGYTGGAVRAPLAMPDEAARRDIERLLSACHVIEETAIQDEPQQGRGEVS
ncbi:MAG: dihydrodipicolinate synthase family protein [Pyrinomonadaceae bacterium]